MTERAEMPVFKIIKLLAEDYLFCRSWKPFCLALKFSSPVMEDLEKMENSHHPIMEIIMKIMTHWKSMASSVTNISTLCQILEDIGCIRCAENVKTLAKEMNADTWKDCTSLPDNFMNMENLRKLVQENLITEDEMDLIKAEIRGAREKQSRFPFNRDSSIMSRKNHKNQMVHQPEENLPEIWNLPPRNSNFVGRVELLKKVEGHFNQGNQPLILTAYHGLGGVGKTHTALEYAWQHYKEYKGVLWFNAESRQRLVENYIFLGRTLHLCLDNEKMTREQQARYVKHWLEDTARAGWLIIYDNAPIYGGEDGINEYIPVKGGKVLITSRYSVGWPQNFSVEVFTRDESKIFIEKVLPGKLSEEEKDTLAENLGDLPLALAQACAYLDKNRRINVSRYLELYRKKKAYLLQDKTLSESQGTIPADSNKATVYITWDITMEAIRKESPLAANWLNCCAYLAANDIPNFLIESFSKNPDNNLNSEIYEEALGILSSYSMLNIDGDHQKSSIHRLVQEVIQLKEGQQCSKRWKTLRSTGHVLINCFPHGDNTHKGRDKISKLMPHLEVCLPYLEIWQQSELHASPQLGKQIEQDIINHLLVFLAEGYHRSGDSAKECEMWERVINIEEKYYGPDHVEVASTLVNLGAVYASLGDSKKALAFLERALKINEKYYGPDHVETGIALTHLGNAYGSLGDAEKQRVTLERALIIDEKFYGLDHVEVAATLESLGIAYGSLGDAEKKKEMLERALAINEKYYGPDHVVIAVTLLNLGNAYGSLGNAEKKRVMLEQALNINEKNYGPDHVNVAAVLVSLGNAYGSLGDAEKQRDLLERALIINEKYYGPDNIEVGINLLNLGNAYELLGDAVRQRDLLERALAIQERDYGPNHVIVAATLTNLGNAYGYLGDSAKKRDLLERALVIDEKYYGSDHVEVAVTLTNLAIAYGSLGNPEKKRDILERVISINEKFYGPDHVEVAVTLTNLGLAYGSLGDSEKNREMLERAFTINEKYYGSDHVKVAVCLTILGSLGKSEKSRDMLEKALVINEKHYGPDHIEVAVNLTNLGKVYGSLGDVEKKRDILERALDIYQKHFGADHGHISATLINLGNAYGLLGEKEKQRDVLERALTINEKYYGASHVNTQFTLKHLIHCYRASENTSAQKELLCENLALIVKDKSILLHAFAGEGFFEAVKVFIASGADFLTRDAHDTVLHQAVGGNSFEVVHFILNLIKDKLGHSEELYQHTINAQDNEGDTPLMWAAAMGNTEILRHLIDYGANVQAKNSDGKTALDWAEQGGHKCTVSCLLKNCTDPKISHLEEI